MIGGGDEHLTHPGAREPLPPGGALSAYSARVLGPVRGGYGRLAKAGRAKRCTSGKASSRALLAFTE